MNPQIAGTRPPTPQKKIFKKKIRGKFGNKHDYLPQDCSLRPLALMKVVKYYT